MQGQKRRARAKAPVGLIADACNQRACSVSDRTRKAEGPLTKGESDTPRKSIDPDSFKRLEFNSTGFELLKPPLERRARASITSDAERAWGQERRAPRASSAGCVFKLSGASAEDVRAMSSEVSQEATSADERAEWAHQERDRDQYVAEGLAVPVAATVAVPVAVIEGVLV